MNENHKRVKVTECNSKLHFVKSIMDVTKKSLFESKNIADSLVCNGCSTGVLLLNESSITVEQWDNIVAMLGEGIKWEYV